MNTNNDLMGSNTGVMRLLTARLIDETGFNLYDTTHFFIGFPTETDFTFMQGMTSNSPITFKLTLEFSVLIIGFSRKPEIRFLRRACFSIQCSQYGPPKDVFDGSYLPSEHDKFSTM